MTSDKISNISNISEDDCYNDYGLQEYALGRLNESIRSDIEIYLGHCMSCNEMYLEIQTEIAYFHHLINLDVDDAVTPCFESLALAGHLDGEGDVEERESIEAHLSIYEKCREEFIQIYQGVGLVIAEMAQLKAMDIPEPQKEGVILTMPKRQKVETTEQLPQFPLRQTGTEE